jgi:F-box/TPR repeat protein Pof3
LTSVRELWKELDLSGARSTVSMTAIRACIRRAKGRLTRAVIDHVIPTAMDKVLELLSRCPDLTHLEVAGNTYDGDKFYNLFKTSKKLKVLITSNEILLTRRCIANFLKDLPNLERFEIGGSMVAANGVAWSGKLPNLKAIALTTRRKDFLPHLSEVQLPYYGHFFDHDQSDPWLARQKMIFESAPNLEELRLGSTPKRLGEGCSVFLRDLCYPRLRRLNLSGVELFGEIQFSPNLEHLSIHACQWGAALALPFQPHLPNLTTLVLDDIPWMTSSHLAAFLNTEEPTLKLLEVRACFKVSGLDIAIAASETSALQKVQALTLEGMYDLDDKAVSQILEATPCLHTLNIPHTAVTGMTIKTIADMRIAEKERRNAQKMTAAVTVVEKDGASPSASPRPSSSYDPDTEKDQKPLVEVLNVKGCENVSLDAVEFGRKRGLKIIR